MRGAMYVRAYRCVGKAGYALCKQRGSHRCGASIVMYVKSGYRAGTLECKHCLGKNLSSPRFTHPQPCLLKTQRLRVTRAPATANVMASPSEHLPVTVVSFNVGAAQSLLTNRASAVDDLRECVGKLGNSAQTDVVCLCELGDYRCGLETTALTMGDLSRGIFPSALGASAGAYGVLWNLHRENCRLLNRAVVVCHGQKRADMMVLQFALTGGATQPAEAAGGASQPAKAAGGASAAVAGLVVGVLHIVSSKKSKATREQCKKILLEAVECVETHKKQCADSIGKDLPIACLIVGDWNTPLGDCNEVAETANKRFRPLLRDGPWFPLASEFNRGGDIALAAGGTPSLAPVAVGIDFPGTAIRRDDHNAVGVKVLLPCRRDGASQPVAASAPVPVAAPSVGASASGTVSQAPASRRPITYPFPFAAAPALPPAGGGVAASSGGAFTHGGACQPASSPPPLKVYSSAPDPTSAAPALPPPVVAQPVLPEPVRPGPSAGGILATSSGGALQPASSHGGACQPARRPPANALDTPPGTAPSSTASKAPDADTGAVATVRQDGPDVYRPSGTSTSALLPVGSAASQPAGGPDLQRQAAAVSDGAAVSGGAFQPARDAEAAAAVSGGAAVSSGASQPARDAEAEQAVQIYANLRQTRSDLPEDEHMTAADARLYTSIGALLFMRRKAHTATGVVPYITLAEECQASITALLRRRSAFLAKKGILDEGHVLTDPERKELMDDWKDEYAALPDQLDQQVRDSWFQCEGKGKGKGKHGRMGFGPNTQKMRHGKRSRFSCMIQREAGNKMMAELILYTGNPTLELMQAAADALPPGDLATPPATAEQKRLKCLALAARSDLRHAKYLRERLARGIRLPDSLLPFERRLLRDLESGHLQKRRNETTLEHGFGVFRDADGQEVDLTMTTSRASQLLNEQRYAADGHAYTYADFVQFYGSDHGPGRWTQAPVASPADFDA